MKPEITKFSLAEAFSSPNGKTSISLICGALVIIAGCFGFTTCGVSMVIFSWTKTTTTTDLQGMATQSVVIIGMGLTLLGIRRFTPDKPLTDPSIIPPAPAQ